MSKSDTFENALLLLIFNNTAIANVGDAGGLRSSVTAGSLYWTLHTADPGEAGSAITNETSYTGYVRQACARASGAGGFTVTGNSVSPFANIVFPISTAGTPTITHFGIVNTGPAGGTAGILLYSGTVTPNIVVSTSVVQTLTTGSTITED